ncbi:acetyl-CoA acetyltransferase [Mycobacterium intracellulare subsp. chimaera]|nr:acetyl-CoA acetyltransferase [Mycobacterium intracellulare subsp. chimaera]ASL20001.1 acetyl-CoA acetyltransferase [Mycobacterium intracellulare subsp. chimaera]
MMKRASPICGICRDLKGTTMPEAVIVSTARSPIGRAMKGSLVNMRPDDLTVQIVKAALDKVPALNPHQIDDLILGCGQPAGESGYNLARVIAVELGFDFLPGTTVNRYCSSSLQTSRMAFHAIKAGEGDAFISAGVETVSRFAKGSADSWPDTKNSLFAEAQERSAAAAEGAEEWHDPRADGNLPDVYIAMGQTAENVALLTGISREDQDHWGVRSQNRAEEAIKSGFFEREITPVTLPDGTTVSTDDGPRPGTTYEKISQLKPVFRPNGTVTAGNACPLNDGAAAVVITSDTKAKELGLTPLARIVSTGVSGLSPEIMGLGPIEATKKALARAKLSVSDIDLFEINEAFAVQVLGSARELGIDEDKLNVSGGAIALGHPFGMTGARIATTLLNNLQTHDKTFGLETMCVGGGQGMAMVIERLS